MERKAKMRILLINTSNFGSTGNIMLDIGKTVAESGKNNSSYYLVAKSRSNLKKHINNRFFIGTIFERNLHLLLSYITGLSGCFSRVSTKSALNKFKNNPPDIIHLHNLHNCYINLPLLFRYIKKHNIRVVWTLHDCWSFTGHCPHFDMIGCDKWTTGCFKCPQYREYPQSLFDNSKFMYSLKKKWFTGVKNMTVVTPSKWLASLVKQSYLKDYPVKVINNGIDLNIFKPTESDFRGKYNLENKYIVLGVAFGWGERKGLDVFIELANRLDGEKYQIVLVGTNAETDKLLPENIISIHRTQNQTELAEIYTAADVFANPTREDNYPTVNMESISCGTPVVTFNTGGSPEIIDETCGTTVAKNDIDGICNEIIKICETKPYSEDDCLKRAESFDKNEKFREYIRLYEVTDE